MTDFNPRYTEPKRGLYSLSKEPFDEAASRQFTQEFSENLDFWMKYSSEIFPKGLKGMEQIDDEDTLVEELCNQCNGSGEGLHDGTKCSTCKGTGIRMVIP